MKCLSPDPSVSPQVYIISPYIKKFVVGVSTSRTIDGYLTKLDSLIYVIEDYFGEETASMVVGDVLRCEEVRESLRPLAGHVREVERLVLSDPRHKLSRKHIDLILATLEELTPVGEPLDAIRPPIFEVEEESVEKPRVTTPPIAAYAWDSTRSGRRGSWPGVSVKVVVLLILVAVLAISVAFLTYNLPDNLPDLQALITPSGRVSSVEVLEEVRRAVYGDKLPSSSVEAVVILLSWVEKNIRYGEVSEGRAWLCTNDNVCYRALSPKELLVIRTGVCIDQAVFMATALLSVNVSPVYIITFDEINHAVAGVVIDNTLFILDQRFPPIEFSDYMEFLKHIRGSPIRDVKVFEFYRTARGVDYRMSELPKWVSLESYERDMLPAKIAHDIGTIVEARRGVTVSKIARETASLIISLDIKVTLEILFINKQYPIARFYTPTFHNGWVEYYAEYVIKQMDLARHEYAWKGAFRYIWVEIVNDGLVVYLAS
jgi:hypothetical protein